MTALLRTALALVLLAPGLRAQAVGPFEAPLESTLTELRSEPSRSIGQTVAFVVQIASVGEPWTPYPTRFGPRDWTRVEGWSDEQHVWERESYFDSTPYLFVAKHTVPEWQLSRARAHERWWVTGRVVQVFAGEPWIEIRTAERLHEHVAEGSVLHASRAEALWKRGQRALALAEIERAMAGPLPGHALAVLEAKWRRWSVRYRSEPEPSSIQPIPGTQTVYHMSLGPQNLPPRRRNTVVPLPASAPRD